MKVRFRIAKRGTTQRQKPVHVPGFENVFIGIEIDREIEKIRNERNRLAILRQTAGLQNIQSFNDKKVRPVDLDPLVRYNVVDQMRVDRGTCGTAARLHIGKEAQQRRQIITFRKTLLFHQAFALQNRVRIEKTVGRNQIDFGDVRPTRQQGLQNAGRR